MTDPTPEKVQQEFPEFVKAEDGSLHFETEEFKENTEHPDKLREERIADLRKRAEESKREMITPDEMLDRLSESLIQVNAFSAKVDDVLRNLDRTMRDLKNE